MSQEEWVWLTIRIGVAAVVGGLVVIAALFWGSGEQLSSRTQLPYVLVAGGAGVGLVFFGTALVNAQRRRLSQQRLEDAMAAVLVAAARVAAGRGTSDANKMRTR